MEIFPAVSNNFSSKINAQMSGNLYERRFCFEGFTGTARKSSTGALDYWGGGEVLETKSINPVIIMQHTYQVRNLPDYKVGKRQVIKILFKSVIVFFDRWPMMIYLVLNIS